ncbi:hypothetical protein HK097_004073 [Rhizophlyctis rosea]|uniref:PWI domain-containing protein n=1 Tax=Rhizophlyctis rosea TaxID=64517 RepID=A0AAD5SJG3_9FUNG|nr:hypothetical protein HK097_004073 [Rhizophlyctis rosea]
MGDAGFFKGTSADQDTRFGNKQKKLLKSMNFPAIYNTKVDIKKVNLTVLKPWITEKVVKLMGFEDDVLIDYIFSLLEESDVDPRNMQIQLAGFLEFKTPEFMEALWNLLVSAQTSIGGIPQEFLDKKKEEIRKKRLETERVTEQLKKQHDKEQAERNGTVKKEHPDRRHRDSDFPRSHRYRRRGSHVEDDYYRPVRMRDEYRPERARDEYRPDRRRSDDRGVRDDRRRGFADRNDCRRGDRYEERRNKPSKTSVAEVFPYEVLILPSSPYPSLLTLTYTTQKLANTISSPWFPFAWTSPFWTEVTRRIVQKFTPPWNQTGSTQAQQPIAKPVNWLGIRLVVRHWLLFQRLITLDILFCQFQVALPIPKSS